MPRSLVMVLGVLLLTLPSLGQSSPDAALPAPPPATEDAPDLDQPPSLLSVEGALTTTNAYVSSGYVEENKGWILQPELTLYLHLPVLEDRDDWTLTPYAGTWNSIHEEKSPDEPEHWYESDVYVGAELAIGSWGIDLSYNHCLAPGDAFANLQELAVTVSYDDTEAGLLPVPLLPFLTLLRELDETRASLLELGVAPTLPVTLGSLEIELSLPLTLGLSLDDYYQDAVGDEQTLGHVSSGLSAAVPLAFLSQWAPGQWELRAAVTYHFLAAQSAQDSNDGGDDRWVGSLGLAFEF